MVAISNVILINSNIESEEYKKFLRDLESVWYLKIKTFKNVNEAINYIKIIEFVETKVIVSGEYYIEFINNFINNINDIKVVPKIAIFTKQKELFIHFNKQYENIINNSFYNYGGIKTTFQEIKQFLINPENKIKLKTEEDNIQMTFEYIDKIEKLALPLFYKTLIELTPDENIEKYTNYIYEKYYNNKDIKELFEQIRSLKNVPIELLSKYYIRAYTIESNFYRDINSDLGLRKKESHLSFIKTLYEGSKLKSLPLAMNNKLLFRGSKISKIEIEKIKYYLNNKIKDLPAAIVFSNSFLSFSKEYKIAKRYLNNKNNNNMLDKVMYILEKDDNMDYSLSTHSDIETLSFFPNEKEVLFYPFSSFEIKSIKESLINGEKIYEIRLLYLGKYLKEIEKNQMIIKKENILPNSEFQKQIIDFGLVQQKKIIKINPKKLYNNYLKYKNEINNNIHKINLNKIVSNNMINNKYNNILQMKYIPKNIDKNDKITNLFFELYNKGLVTGMIDIKHKGEIVAKKFIISQKYLNNDFNLILSKWIPAWHGTKTRYLESIIKYGLKKPGTKLSNSDITPEPQFGNTGVKIDNIQNWQIAIFASPRILCASGTYYSDQIEVKNRMWSCLLDVRIKPNSFTKHSSERVFEVITCHHMPIDPIDDVIYRIESQDNITIVAITFFDRVNYENNKRPYNEDILII